MVSFIDDHRGEDGVEPICAVVADCPVDVLRVQGPRGGSFRLRPRARRDGLKLSGEIQRVYDENFRVYGVRKVWRQLNREQI